MSANPLQSSSLHDVVIIDSADARLASGFDHPHRLFIDNLREQISRRAYELAEQRGFEPGHDVEDWLRAERDVLAAPVD